MTIDMEELKTLKVTLWDRTTARLGRFWEDGPLVLVFLRHYGWPFCREQVAQLRRKEAKFARLGARVVLVGLGTPRETEIFKEQFDVPFEMVSDPKRRLYKAFELRRGSTSDLLSVDTFAKGLTAMFRGYRPGIPKGDVSQLPGVFIIDSAGRIRFSHYARDAADNPDPEVLLEVLHSDFSKRPPV